MRLTAILLGVLLLAITSALAYSVRPQPETVRAGPSRVRPFTDYAPPVPDLSALAREKPPASPVKPATKVERWKPLAPTNDGAWSCGGSLPTCTVLHRENPNRDLTVYNGGGHYPVGYVGGNPTGDSTASGKWQILRSTWAGFGGFVNAADAPWQVQDAKARLIWANGRGCSAWKAC